MRVISPKSLFLLLWILGFAGCASSPNSVSSVLEPAPVEPEATQSAADALPAPPAAPRPGDQLVEQLRKLGYQGLGLEFEDPKTIELLEKVFAAPDAQGRDIKLVYTGMRLQYDAAQKSITIGGTKDLKAILTFIKKKVPKGPPAPVPPPTESSQAPILPNQ